MSMFGFTTCDWVPAFWAGLGFVIFWAILFSWLKSKRQQRILNSRGECVMATITKKSIQRRSTGDFDQPDHKEHRLYYTFRIPAPDNSDSAIMTIADRTSAPEELWDKAEVGQDLEIIYDKENPQKLNMSKARFDDMVETNICSIFCYVFCMLLGLSIPIAMVCTSECLHSGHFWMDVLGSLYIVLFLGNVAALAWFACLSCAYKVSGRGEKVYDELEQETDETVKMKEENEGVEINETDETNETMELNKRTMIPPHLL